METDDGIRGPLGIVVSVLERPSGEIRLIFDDVAKSSKGAWRHEWFFTWRDIPKDRIDSRSLSERELADIGLAIISRLSARLDQLK